jgi:hypothetical protein
LSEAERDYQYALTSAGNRNAYLADEAKIRFRLCLVKS